MLNDLLNQIAQQGLKIGNNWVIVQNGENLWVQNFISGGQQPQNQTGGGAEQPAQNQTIPSGVEN